ncbi:MAG: RloB family protein [Bacteroidota bacterium]
MILTNRLFTRREPEKDAKKIYVFCEGKKRECQYFQYFQGIDSRINIVVHPLQGNENNSPTGLYQLANQCFSIGENAASPTYELLEEDEVWFVIDTDTWGAKVAELRTHCQSQSNWKIAQSNPCFEVWLYFHLFHEPAKFQWMEICETWKSILPDKIPGGFQSNKHSIFIGRAINNARSCFALENDAPAAGCTEVFQLAAVIYGFCRKKIEGLLYRL